MKWGWVGTLLVLLVTGTLLGGCWDARGLEARGFVVMMGVDKIDEGRFFISLQVQREAPGGGGQAGQAPRSFRVITTEAETIEAALAQAAGMMVRNLDLTILDTIVIGETAAADLSALDFFARSTRFPVSTNVSVARGRAEAVVRAETPGFPLPADYTIHGFSGAWTQSPEVVRTPVWQVFQRAMYSPLEDPFAPAMTDQRYGLNWDGIAVFQGPTLAGFLTPREAGLFNLILGERREYGIATVLPSNPPIKVSLTIDQTKVRRQVVWHRDGPVLSVQVAVSGTLQELTRMRIQSEPGQRQVEEALGQVLADDITALLHRLQELGVDPLGFGERARRASPFHPLVRDRKSWHQAYKDARVSATVTAQVTSTGYMK